MSNSHVRFDAYVEKHRGTGSAETPAMERPKGAEIDEEFKFRATETGGSGYIEDLVNVARGAAMILDSMWEHMEDSREQAIISGLANALRNVVEPADAYFFKSVGELNRRIPPKHLAHLLEEQLVRARKAAAEAEAELDRATAIAKLKGRS